jgi:hypothetical protein
MRPPEAGPAIQTSELVDGAFVWPMRNVIDAPQQRMHWGARH